MRRLVVPVALFLFISPTGTVLPQQVAPPTPVVVPAGCPFEGCQYGKWTAREPAEIRSSINGPAGEIRATPRKATVTKIYKTDVTTQRLCRGLYWTSVTFPFMKMTFMFGYV